jgi:hypothetical protein
MKMTDKKKTTVKASSAKPQPRGQKMQDKEVGKVRGGAIDAYLQFKDSKPTQE